MTATTRTTECNAPAATLFLAFELGSKKWTLGFTTAPAQRPRLRTIRAGDLDAVVREIADAKVRFHLAPATPVRSCYEAGRDGFWLHRWLLAQGIANVVVDSSSIEVNRRKRRAKTDGLDVRKLLSQLQRWAAGETKAWSVVRVPTVEAEDARHLVREIETVHAEWTAQRNRIQGLLAAHGASLALTRHFLEDVATAQTGDGRPLPPGLRGRLGREWAYYQTLDQRQRDLAAERTRLIAEGETRVAAVARQLLELRGIGEISAALFSAELFGTRTFKNGREVGALSGYAPVPYRSDQSVADQGISRRGRAALRRVATQVAWCWVRWQPTSVLTQWFHTRFGTAGKRARRIGIVAVARKLLIALWRYSAHGVLPEGATRTSEAAPTV
jgi:transposase